MAAVGIEDVVIALEEEFDKLRRDAAERAHEAGRGAILVGSAGALGLVSVGAIASLPLFALRRMFTPTQLALIVAGGSAAGAAILGRLGMARLAAISPEALEEEVKGAAKEVASEVP
jgi:hypothetical protein